MRIHARHFIVTEAHNKFTEFLLKWEREHELTYGEMFSILGNEIASLAKYCIREERHPDEPDKRGDEE